MLNFDPNKDFFNYTNDFDKNIELKIRMVKYCPSISELDLLASKTIVIFDNMVDFIYDCSLADSTERFWETIEAHGGKRINSEEILNEDARFYEDEDMYKAMKERMCSICPPFAGVFEREKEENVKTMLKMMYECAVAGKKIGGFWEVLNRY